MAEESDGTNSYFKLIGIVKEVLDEGTPLVVDELDAHLHPLLTKHLVSLFNSVEFNPNGAQLIFTSYNTNLLDLDVLRRDQIWFAEKDELTAATDLFSLQAFSIRKDTKLEKAPQDTLIPFAPMRIARPMHCFIARRKPMRFSS